MQPHSDASSSSASSSSLGFGQKILPSFIYEHGRTVYGGNPIVQQTLPGWFAYLSSPMLIPILYAFMLPFLVVGGLMLAESPGLYQVAAVYSHIHKYQYIPSDPLINVNQGLRSFTADGVTHTQGTRTWMTFSVTKRMESPVYLYYTIENMFQNFRDFHDGRSTAQLAGKTNIGSTYLCQPFSTPGFLNHRGDLPVTFNGQTVAASSFTYYPCGLAAWAMFNDTFTLYRVADSTRDLGVVLGGEDGLTPLLLLCNGTDFNAVGDPLGGSVTPNQCSKKGISWRADTEVRFKPLVPGPRWWSRHFPFATSNDYLNSGWYLDEPGHELPNPSDLDFQVWMKSSVRSSFRKLYRILHVDLEPGLYTLQVEEFYDTTTFRGRKGILLRTTHWFGASNMALGVVFVVMGCLCFILGVAFTIECVLRRRGINRLERLTEPRRSWYLFDPRNAQFEKYYALRTERVVPTAELNALRHPRDEADPNQ